MITPRHILWGIVLPAIVALIVTIAGQLGVRRDRKTQPWGPALAIAGGFAAAYYGIVGQLPHWPPTAAQGWLFYLAGAAVIVAAVATPVRSIWIDAAFSVVVLALTAWLLSRPRAQTMEAGPFWICVAAVAGGMIVWWIGIEGLSVSHSGGTLPLLLSAWAGATAIVLVNAHTQSLGQIAGGVAVALLCVACVGFWFRNLSLAHGSILAVAVTVLGLALCGHYFADLTLQELLILAVAPTALSIGEVQQLRRRPWARFIVSAVMMLAILSTVVVPAAKGLKQTMDEQKSYQY